MVSRVQLRPRPSRAFLFAGAILALLATSAPAAALPAQPKGKVAAPDPNEKKALELYEQGRKAYKEGRYDEAIDLLKQSYALKAEPVLQYNLARAYESAGRLEDAVASFESYLALAKDIPDRTEIEAKLGNLKSRIEEQKKAKAAPPPPPPENKPAPPPAAPPPARGISPVPWIVAGVGVLGIGAGGVLGGLAASKNDEVASAPSQTEGQSLRDSAESLALGSNIAFGIGGAIALAGGIWGVIDIVSAGSSEEKPAPLKAAVGPGFVTISTTF